MSAAFVAIVIFAIPEIQSTLYAIRLKNLCETLSKHEFEVFSHILGYSFLSVGLTGPIQSSFAHINVIHNRFLYTISTFWANHMPR